MRAPADGYTLEMGTSTTNMLLGGLYPLQFDLIDDLAPILLIASEPLMIVGKKDLPANDLKELIAWLKANPDKASIGIPAVGGTGHLAGLSFLKEIGTKAQFIPYRGNGPALQDLVAGQIDLQIEPASNFFAQVKAGSDQALRHHRRRSRSTAAGDIPTTDEAGLPGFHASLWYGLWAPKDTPKDIVAQAQRGDAGGAGARRDAQALRRPRPRNAAARAADAGGACARSRRPKPTSGGRSSRPPTSRGSEPAPVEDVA